MNKPIVILLLSILFSGCYTTGGRSLAQQSLEKNEGFKHASVGISIRNCATGKEIMNVNGEKSLRPASVLKLITTATALEILGPTYKFETRLGYTGTLQDGVLDGDIIIFGGGDPTLGSSYFEGQNTFITPWLQAIKNLGIKEIKGKVESNVNTYSSESISPKWIWEDIGNYYGAGSYGLSVFDNLYTVHFRSTKLGQEAKIAAIEPPIPNLTIQSLALGSKNKSDSAYIFGGPNDYNKIIRGTIPANRMSFSIKGAMPNPPLFLAQYLSTELRKSGIQVNETASLSHKYSDAHIFFHTYSPPLSDIIKVINEKSNNLYANHVLWALTSDPNGHSHENGIQKIYEYWTQKGFNMDGMQMHDGSGLSPVNVINASLTTEILSYVQSTSLHADAFLQSLPFAGEEGTVKYFLRASQLKGKVRAKSGSMDGVRAYAGYITKQDKTYAFAIQVNYFKGSSRDLATNVEDYLERIYADNL